jgi:bacterial/archaeal transporter family-2 protein
MFNNLTGEVMALLLAALSGVLMAVQGSLNAALSKAVGILESTFIVHITGTIIVVLLLYVLRLGKGNMALYGQAPWYAYLGGAVGVGIIYLVVSSIPKVGVANATTAIIVGQVLAALAIDHFGLFGLQRMPCGWCQLAGLLLLAVGAKLLLKH